MIAVTKLIKKLKNITYSIYCYLCLFLVIIKIPVINLYEKILKVVTTICSR